MASPIQNHIYVALNYSALLQASAFRENSFANSAHFKALLILRSENALGGLQRNFMLGELAAEYDADADFSLGHEMSP